MKIRHLNVIFILLSFTNIYAADKKINIGLQNNEINNSKDSKTSELLKNTKPLSNELKQEKKIKLSVNCIDTNGKAYEPSDVEYQNCIDKSQSGNSSLNHETQTKKSAGFKIGK